MHDQADPDVLVLWIRLRNQQRQRSESGVVDDRVAGGVDKAIVAVEKVDEQQRRASLVSIGEGMVLDDEVEQVAALDSMSG